MKSNLKQLVVAGLYADISACRTCSCHGGGERQASQGDGHGRFGAFRPFGHSDGCGQRHDHLREEQP